MYATRHFLLSKHHLSSQLGILNATRIVRHSSSQSSVVDHSASSKLFADAATEEAEGASSFTQRNVNDHLTQQHPNWTGDESVQDAVLRMLVDKYKPLRGDMRSADEKLKEKPPSTSEAPAHPSAEASLVATTEQVEESATYNGEHRPWLVTFKVPSHAVHVRARTFSPSSASTRKLAADELVIPLERSEIKRREKAEKLSRAKESTLDYRLGKFGGHRANALRRPNPVGVKAWASLVEERIERARSEGQFKVISGRGKPLERLSAERNPFVAREEFLMNRIVQRNGAAPPWVELQLELESALSSFREILKQSWTRRALRNLTIDHPLPLLANLPLTEATSLRDPEWEEKERVYHEAAIEDINSLVRKYNGVAPYPVRRSYYVRTAELERVREQCGEDILRGVAQRLRDAETGWTREACSHSDEDDGRPHSKTSGHRAADTGHSTGLWAMIRQWWYNKVVI